MRKAKLQAVVNMATEKKIKIPKKIVMSDVASETSVNMNKDEQIEVKRRRVVVSDSDSADQFDSPVKSSGKRSRRSVIWNHFNEIKKVVGNVPVEYIQCKYCSKEYPRTDSSTGNIMRHLRLLHPEVFGATSENFVFSTFEQNGPRHIYYTNNVSGS